ncbi:MAG: hypothetical protein JNG89_10445 [Planctomycetaceae bacterium]|nr:hypothetical protein [Planctomycetaceae bacterium]
MQRISRSRTSWRKFAKFSVLYAALAGAAVLYGESQREDTNGKSKGVFWLEGRSWWAPDYGKCSMCGEDLRPMVDAISACRRCDRCQIDFRHKSLPATIEEQERVWK